jgi:hypothetical protein
MARPLKDPLSKKSRQLRIRLTDTEYYWIQEVAKEHHTDMSSLLRATFTEYIRFNYSDDDISKIAVKIADHLKSPVRN